ncbi:hypothetical protein B0H14DRAFT_3468726 [Mycena olivaceomarginata]|nr:hypothetical protein B0H14DRAFT_3468726 [Mycena olivaceomarginata]
MQKRPVLFGGQVVMSTKYEIIYSPETVDLLVSLCYSAAAKGVLDEPLPKGMALHVPCPTTSSWRCNI